MSGCVNGEIDIRSVPVAYGYVSCSCSESDGAGLPVDIRAIEITTQNDILVSTGCYSALKDLLIVVQVFVNSACSGQYN